MSKILTLTEIKEHFDIIKTKKDIYGEPFDHYVTYTIYDRNRNIMDNLGYIYKKTKSSNWRYVGVMEHGSFSSINELKTKISLFQNECDERQLPTDAFNCIFNNCYRVDVVVKHICKEILNLDYDYKKGYVIKHDFGDYMYITTELNTLKNTCDVIITFKNSDVYTQHTFDNPFEVSKWLMSMIETSCLLGGAKLISYGLHSSINSENIVEDFYSVVDWSTGFPKINKIPIKEYMIQELEKELNKLKSI